ncbi:MAG: EAL domain-containing protein [Treponema sp.]|nr:EAL domain-containing protein [Treponema sp.]
MSEAEDIASKEIVAYFQPIIAADTNTIYSYEVLGRYMDGGVAKSLGPFFSAASSKEALKVDRIVRESALRQFAKEGKGEYLFVNLRLDWLAQYADRPEELPTILWAKEFGIDLHQLVIEITEEEFIDDNEAFAKVIAYYRDAGCRIAIDDYGRNASHIDRLALISPDILKIDMSYIHRSEGSYHYREYLKSLTSFAEQVGIEVLYEGIETPGQLDICIASRGRFYQGFLLAKPQPSIKDAVTDHRIFSMSTQRFIKAQQEDFSSAINQYDFWDAMVESFIRKNGSDFLLEDSNSYLFRFCHWLPVRIKRVYVCNRHGDQLSHNLEVEPENIHWKDSRNKNWAWRSFFRDAMSAMDAGRKSYLTNVYRDVTTKEKIYTYIYKIQPDLYLFVDCLREEA